MRRPAEPRSSATPGSRSLGRSRLERLARWCHRRRGIVLGAWIAALAGVAALSVSAGSELSNAFNVPGAESQRALELLYERFPEQSGFGAELVFTSDGRLDEPAVGEAVNSLVAEVEALPHVAEVVSPYEPEGAFQTSADRRVGFARVRFDMPTFDVPAATVEEILDAAERADGTILQVEVGGTAVQFAAQTDPGRSEQIGFLAAGIILFLTFGSLVAMGLPMATALFGLGVALLGLRLLAHVFPVPSFGPSLAAMIGIGVGIDYALFILTRFRASLRDGSDSEAACGVALATSGRSVLFAGVTVCVALLGLFVIGMPMVEGMAISAITAVLMAMVASVTLVPAMLGFAGPSVNRFGPPWLARGGRPRRRSAWAAWSRVIQRHPWPAALGAFALLLVLTAPVLGMRLGMSDAGSNPTGTTTRRAFDLIADGFGPGFNGPLLVASELRGLEDVVALERVAAAIRDDAGVHMVAPPRINATGDAGVVFVVPATAPQDAGTTDLIERLRERVIPYALQGHDLDVAVGGATAVYNDLTDLLARRLPAFMAVVIGLSFFLLLVVFRSLLVPLKAAVMNLLSIGGAYGVIVAVFQWGWLSDLFGVDRTGPIQSFVPMMLFAILFGLSMDYEVFLISRIREEYERTRDNATAVADGLAATGRVITAAAAIMIAVFGSFVFGDDTILKVFGLGLATAIFLDAAIVRTILVPATMELLGAWNWWLPGWLHRRLPRIGIDAAPRPTAVAGTGDPAEEMSVVASS